MLYDILRGVGRRDDVNLWLRFKFHQRFVRILHLVYARHDAYDLVVVLISNNILQVFNISDVLRLVEVAHECELLFVVVTLHDVRYDGHLRIGLTT